MSKFEVSWFSCHKVFRKLGYVLTKILKGTSYNYSTTLKRDRLAGIWIIECIIQLHLSESEGEYRV